MCYEGACVASVNGCNINTAQDFTMVAPPPITLANGNFTYAPKCIKVSVGTTLTFNGNFGGHPTIGGTVGGGVATPATSGPFIPVTNTGVTKNFTMMSPGTPTARNRWHERRRIRRTVRLEPTRTRSVRPRTLHVPRHTIQRNIVDARDRFGGINRPGQPRYAPTRPLTQAPTDPAPNQRCDRTLQP